MSIITLTSDYGLLDHYLPALKGALLGELDNLQLVDISHQIEPGNFFEASFILRNCYAAFPKKTVHLIAFSEIAASGRLLAAEMDEHFFLVADNGLLPMINPDLRITKIVEIDLKQEPGLFPSRDILTRAAAHLARGGNLGLLGREIKEIEQKTALRPRVSQDKNSIIGSVVYIDNYGNLITNISRKKFKEVGKERKFEILLPRRHRVEKIRESYTETSAGNIIALFNSQNLLEIAISESRGKKLNGANTLLGIEVQNTITINFQ